MSDSIPVLDRTEQQRHYGIDCGDAVRFDAGTWLPGGEHVKKITVKNVSRRTIKFKYELPTTKYFSMDFPTLITLSPGMHTVLDIAFRPLKVEEYDDFVTFSTQIIEGGVVASSGRFRIPVIARIAKLAFEIPHGLDFGFCPTAETTKLKLFLRNTGQVDLAFSWSIPGAGSDHGRPFAIHPESGQVRVGDRLELTASFAPRIASVYVTTTMCVARPVTTDESSCALEQSMKLSGISKFTHIVASDNELNFGDVLVGAPNSSHTPTEREFVLRNRSLVRASFQVVRQETDCEPVFSFSPTSGVVPPESSTTIRVRYAPSSAGTFTCDHYDIVTPGGNREQITCKGRAMGPTVTVWKKNLESNFVHTRSLNFGDLSIGRSTSRVLTLRNESSVDVFFHFDCQESGTFTFDKVNGRIPPLLETNVTVSFAPQRPGNFYRRFFLLVQHQSVQFVDVLGTGYDDKVRPSPFQLAHVDAYRQRVAAGLGLLSPDQLETYWQDNGDDLFLGGAARRLDSDGSDEDHHLPARTQLLTRSGEATIAEVDASHEFFINADHRGNPIVAQSGFVDFSNCSIIQYPSKKVLHVTNNTHGKVTCAWHVASDQPNTFQIFPDTLDISAGAAAEFRIAFQPSTENAYYFAELEGYVSFKSNRTFRLVNVETFTPPWCVLIKVCGNTFASPTEQFLPKITFRLPRKNKVFFPPCFVGDSVFQTIFMDNAGDTPAVFAFADDPSLVFECKPSSGYIGPKSFHLVQLRFTPRKARSYTHSLQCIVNNARATPILLELSAIAAQPVLTVDDHEQQQTAVQGHDVRLYIKPTAVGLLSSRTITITNATRVPLVYRWEIPHKVHDAFDLSPKIGRLNGRESISIICCFTPQEVRAYASRFLVAVKPISVAWSPSQSQSTRQAGSVPLLQELMVRVQTRGTAGAIAFDPEAMQFDTILVNSSAKRTLFIVNTADCDLHFVLAQQLRVLSCTAPSGSDIVPARLEFSESRGCIPARSRKQIAATFLPCVAGVFSFDVACYSSIDSAASLSAHSYQGGSLNSAAVLHCTIRAEASFPTILFEDVRVPGLPTSLAWHQFLCDEINRHMAAPPPIASKDSPRPESNGMPAEHDDPEHGVKHVAFPFSPAPHGSPPQQVFFKLRNPGSLVVDFSLRYPKEGNVEIEHWAETGAPSSDEIRTNAIIDSKVFQIAPRRGTLLPQQSITLAMSYAFASDSYGGIHDLSVLLQVDKGTSLVLDLQGRTLLRNEPKLFLPRRVFPLSPVMIGEYRRPFTDHHGHERDLPSTMGPPVHQIEVFNRGDAAFRLEVSSNAFAKINQHAYHSARGSGNFPYPVLRCITTSEIVPAHSSAFIDIEFAPIEAKTVEANLILKAHGLMGRPYKEVTMVTLLATGYHPHHTSLSAMQQELALASGGSPAPAQGLTVPGQCVRFGSDHLAFNHVPTNAQRNELLVLVNESRGDEASPVVNFHWDEAHPLVASGVIKFSPARGQLAAGQELLIRVTITTSAQLQIVDHDIACTITSCLDSASSPVRTAVTSPTRKPSNNEMATKARPSVVTRSTAAQEAARTLATTAQQQPPLSPMNRKREALPMSPPPVSYVVFAHVYAHVITPESLEYSMESKSLAMPQTVESSPGAASSTVTSTRLPQSPSEVMACQQVVVQVMETLFADVLVSHAVQCAMTHSKQSRSRDDGTGLVFAAARQSDDCASITTSVMENTVFNILQELFHGDIEQELMCVPRKQVFPKLASPRKATTTAH